MITISIVSTKLYDTRDHLNFDIVNFSFLMEIFLAPLPLVFFYFATYFFFAGICSNEMLMTSTTETYFLTS